MKKMVFIWLVMAALLLIVVIDIANPVSAQVSDDDDPISQDAGLPEDD